MSQFDKLIQKILDEKDITYQESEKALLYLGYIARAPKGGSSHITYKIAQSNYYSGKNSETFKEIFSTTN